MKVSLKLERSTKAFSDAAFEPMTCCLCGLVHPGFDSLPSIFGAVHATEHNTARVEAIRAFSFSSNN